MFLKIVPQKIILEMKTRVEACKVVVHGTWCIFTLVGIYSSNKPLPCYGT